MLIPVSKNTWVDPTKVVAVDFALVDIEDVENNLCEEITLFLNDGTEIVVFLEEDEEATVEQIANHINNAMSL